MDWSLLTSRRCGFIKIYLLSLWLVMGRPLSTCWRKNWLFLLMVEVKVKLLSSAQFSSSLTTTSFRKDSTIILFAQYSPSPSSLTCWLNMVRSSARFILSVLTNGRVHKFYVQRVAITKMNQSLCHTTSSNNIRTYSGKWFMTITLRKEMVARSWQVKFILILWCLHY